MIAVMRLLLTFARLELDVDAFVDCDSQGAE